jgi:hypothetical protein
VTYSIISIESGKLLESFDSEEAALETAQAILRDEPDASGTIAVVTFDQHGHPEHALQGDDLAAALGGVAA